MAATAILEPPDAGHLGEDELHDSIFEGPAPRASRRLGDRLHRVAIRGLRTATATPAKFVSRASWGARAPRERTALSPARGVAGHWEGVRVGPLRHDQCAGKVRAIQNYHMDRRGYSDIAYTAVICPHGYVFEGRWLRVRTAANGTNAANGSLYAVCWLAGPGDPFPEPSQVGFRSCFEFLRRHGGAGPEVPSHQELKSTECPGSARDAWLDRGMPVPSAPPPPKPAPPKPPPPTSNKESIDVTKLPVLRRGSHTRATPMTLQQIRNLQGLMIANGCNAKVLGNPATGMPDAVFGGGMERELRSWQQRARKAVTGTSTEETWRGLIGV